MSRPDNRLRPPLASAFDDLPAGWRPVVERWRAGPQGAALTAFLEQRLAAGATIYPAEPLRALRLTPPERVRVVVLGQDPYHGSGQAEGLAFSVPPGVGLPPSLRNILKERERDLGLPLPAAGHLGAWARRGALLLNAVLTVEDAAAGSHSSKGWQALTDSLIEQTAGGDVPKVFLLWGASARAAAPRIQAAGRGRHLVLEANHPSPLSANRAPLPFIGCGHFRRTLEFLAAHGAADFDWTLS